MSAYRVFIAYAGPDLNHAIELYDHINRINPAIRAFLDCRCLSSDDDFNVALPLAQESCLVTAALISTNTMEAFYEHAELTLGIELERSSKKARHRVIPVWVDKDSYARRPYQLMNRQGLHLYDKMTWAETADAIIDVVKRMLSGTEAKLDRQRGEIELGALFNNSRELLAFGKELEQDGLIDSEQRKEYGTRILDEVRRRVFPPDRFSQGDTR